MNGSTPWHFWYVPMRFEMRLECVPASLPQNNAPKRAGSLAARPGHRTRQSAAQDDPLKAAGGPPPASSYRRAFCFLRQSFRFFLAQSLWLLRRASWEHSWLQNLFFGSAATNRFLHTAQNLARQGWLKRNNAAR